MQKRLLAFFVALATPVLLLAQQPAATAPQAIPGTAIPKGNAKISGTVLDALTRNPVEFATVVLVNPETGKPIDGTMADDKGRFTIGKVAMGKYRLQVSFLGYQQLVVEQVEVSTDNAEVNVGTIVLSVDAKQLKEVEIVGERPLIEEKVDRLVYNADKDISAMGGTAADVLRNVPLLSVDPDGNVQLRGSSNVRVLINNRPSTIMAGSIADAIRQIPADIIKSVEVITSPSAKYDAEGTAGIINIITKKNTLQGITGGGSITPGNVSTIGNASLNYRRSGFGLNSSMMLNQFYNRGTTYLERFSKMDETTFIQQGKTRNRSGFVNPTVGFDVDLSDKSSLGGGFRLNTAHNFVRNEQVVTNSLENAIFRRSDIDVVSRTKSLGYDLNLDYMRTFKKPQQEFSILTLYSLSDSDNQSNQDEYNPDQQLIYQQRNLNESQNKELTLQTDYTHPFENKTMLEAGAKTILRFASSDVDYNNIYPQQPDLSDQSENRFSYNQDVYAGYFTYGFQLQKKLNVKVGGRYEHTFINADYQTMEKGFSTSYKNFIPSVAMSYTYKEKHTFRGNFTQRIQRPQLYFLNPYREVIAPKIILVGNPKLDAELTDMYEANYGTYTNMYSVNAGLWSRSTSNAIASDPYLSNDTTYITFQNIASSITYGMNVYGSIKPKKGWSIGSNVNLYHSYLEGENISNQGWMYNINANTSYELPRGWMFRFNGSFNSRRVTLQGKQASFYYHNMTLRKEILNKRGGIGINLANPFMKGTRVRNNIETSQFVQRESNINFTRGVRATFEYRFGKLEQAKPRKPKKSISNDDALRG